MILMKLGDRHLLAGVLHRIAKNRLLGILRVKGERILFLTWQFHVCRGMRLFERLCHLVSILGGVIRMLNESCFTFIANPLSQYWRVFRRRQTGLLEPKQPRLLAGLLPGLRTLLLATGSSSGWSRRCASLGSFRRPVESSRRFPDRATRHARALRIGWCGRGRGVGRICRLWRRVLIHPRTYGLKQHI